jgi:hypothetical protein
VEAHPVAHDDDGIRARRTRHPPRRSLITSGEQRRQHLVIIRRHLRALSYHAGILGKEGTCAARILDRVADLRCR